MAKYPILQIGDAKEETMVLDTVVEYGSLKKVVLPHGRTHKFWAFAGPIRLADNGATGVHSVLSRNSTTTTRDDWTLTAAWTNS